MDSYKQLIQAVLLWQCNHISAFPLNDTHSMFLSQELLIEANMNQFSCVKPQKSKHTEVKMSFVCMDFHIHFIDSCLSCLI